jgi:osmotically-inducible protein OsmY
MKSVALKTSLLCAALALAGASLQADAKDVWITTKTKIALLTADDVKVSAVHVDTKDGAVTLHGKVRSAAEKERAEQAARKVDGVKRVDNMLQVVPEAAEDAVQASDEQIEQRVEASLKADASLAGVEVESVSKGVVLLSGEASLDGKLNAIEKVLSVDGVRQVRDRVTVKDAQPKDY